MTARQFPAAVQGRTAEFFGYAARGPLGQPDERDDGTIAPTAALGSLAFAPEICVPAANAMQRWPHLYGKYGFLDSFNPRSAIPTSRLETDRSTPRVAGWRAITWASTGRDRGAIANTRDEGVWRVMRRSPAIRRGLQRAGFTGGWLG